MDWNDIGEEYLRVASEVFNELRQPIEDLGADLAERIRKGHKVMVCGNGGSAADAQHFAGELVNRFLKERKPYAAVALSTDTSVLTSIGNDYGFEQVFEKQVRALGREGDALIGISTSGKAQNVCRAVSAAREMGIHTTALTGGDGGELLKLADLVLSVSRTKCVPRIQEGHQLVIHALCERIEEILE